MDRKPAIEVEIRPFAPSDQEGVRWLFARTPPWGRTYPRQQALPEDLEEIARSCPTGCFVATEQDQDGEAIVGFVAVAAVGSAEKEQLPEFLNAAGTISRLHHVSIAPERWRLGIGRRLTETAIEWSRRNGCHAAILETTDKQEGAIELYETRALSSRDGAWWVSTAWCGLNSRSEAHRRRVRARVQTIGVHLS